MKARLYGMAISHPAKAARLMLERKGIDYELVNVAPGYQAGRMRLAGFRGGTVPGLALGGRKVTGTRQIARFLDEVRPHPPLFPVDREERRAVEAAEAWGEQVLQPIPRRALRHAVRYDPHVRLFFAGLLGNPRPELTHRLIVPAAAYYARREDAASADRVAADWAALPGHLDHVDGLLSAGVIGGDEPNAADFQIATTVRVLLSIEDYAPVVAGRPAEAFARRIWPDYRFAFPALRRT